MPYTVFVVSDIAIFREGISTVLVGEPNFQLVGSSGFDQRPSSLDCDLYIVDCAGLEPIEFEIFCVTLHRCEIPVVALGLPVNDEVILDYLEAGASAYVTKDSGLNDLFRTALTTIENGACVDTRDLPAILSRLRADTTRSGADFDGPSPLYGRRLTSREREVALLLGRHLSNKEIATELGISVNTVKHHVHNALVKLGVSKRSQALAALAGKRSADR